MYSLVTDGKVLDYRFKRINNFTYTFYTGDIMQGQIFKLGNTKWSAVAWKAITCISALDNFNSRVSAAEAILKLNGYEV